MVLGARFRIQAVRVMSVAAMFSWAEVSAFAVDLKSSLDARDDHVEKKPIFGDISVVADFNGDSRRDLAVGVPAGSIDFESTELSKQGAVYVQFQSKPGPGSIITLRPSADIPKESRAHFGHYLDAEDYNNDGVMDLVVADRQPVESEELRNGRFWLYIGHTGSGGFEQPILIDPSAGATDFVAPKQRRQGKQLVDDKKFSGWSDGNGSVEGTFRSECELSPTIPWSQMNALQKHVAFFDLNGNGYITVDETYRGLRDIGVNAVLAVPAAITINVGLATPTAGYPSLVYHIDNIDAALHGSDTGLYDEGRRFVAEAFDEWFQMWDLNGDGALNLRELLNRTIEESDYFDFFGFLASGGEFGVLYLVAAQGGKISRDRMYSFYDGTLFYRIAADKGTLGCRVGPSLADY
jgi:peroxygenase